MVIPEEKPTFLLTYIGKEFCGDTVQYSLISYNPITQICTLRHCPILSFSFLHPEEKESALWKILNQQEKEEPIEDTWLCKQYGLYATWNARTETAQVCINQLATEKAYLDFLKDTYTLESEQ